MDREDVCFWEDDDEIHSPGWKTSCGETVKSYRFCPFCGRRIEMVSAEENEDEPDWTKGEEE